MALELARECKGINANYWRILSTYFDANTNTTTVTLGLYESKRARTLGVNNNLDQTTFRFDGFCNQAESYTRIRASNIQEVEITPAVTEGSVTTNDYVVITPAVTEKRETNPFVNSLDI
jgi:hypothetical protein